jgi:hypothetical protein
VSLKDNLNADYAPAWRPEPGGMLIGVVTALSEREGAYGVYPIVTVRQDDGTDHAFHDVARAKLARAKPKVGERIGIKYLGKRDRQSGQPYHDYKVEVDRPDGDVDWGKYGEGGDDVPF